MISEVVTVVIETKGNNMPQFLQDHADTGLKLDLLRFWRKYPYAKFTCGIIARAVDCRRRVDVEEALECFVRAELLEEHTRQGLRLYCLTNDPLKRQGVFDWVTN